jgi:hypothetical protein
VVNRPRFKKCRKNFPNSKADRIFFLLSKLPDFFHSVLKNADLHPADFFASHATKKLEERLTRFGLAS